MKLVTVHVPMDGETGECHRNGIIYESVSSANTFTKCLYRFHGKQLNDDGFIIVIEWRRRRRRIS